MCALQKMSFPAAALVLTKYSQRIASVIRYQRNYLDCVVGVVSRIETLKRFSSTTSARTTAASAIRHDPTETEINKNMNSNSNSNDNNPTPDHNAFHVFDLPYQFGIDEIALRTKYREFMKQLHPDQQHSRPSSRNDNNHHSVSTNIPPIDASTVTRAYEILKQPHERATHLLQKLGIPLEEHTNTSVVGACFLMDIMLKREEIETANQDQGKLKSMFESNNQQLKLCCQQLEQAFAKNNYDQARKLTAQLQYWNRIDEKLRDVLDTLG